MKQHLTLCAALLIGLVSTSLQAADIQVADQQAFKQAIKVAEPGDAIVLKDGVWKNFEIGFFAEGKKDKPITLRAQTPGGVIISGLSNLRLAGNYLVVEGLVFKNGHSPTGELIAFKRNDVQLANNSRVTQLVIDNFNNPDRDEADYWVAIYGKHNRFDHNYLAGKRNLGVTLTVRLINKESQNNYHRIDHNYFGPRPILGSNGGETMRIGTSTYSLSDSHTLIEDNYFDRCNGEVEVVSIKSGKNIIRNNVFFESRGTLTLRHGNGNLVEGNVFFGNGAEHTGGIRVINRDQVVRNNYLEGLTGSRFGSGFAVMNGTVNAPINRYGQVVNAKIENNTFINVDNIQLGAGADSERNAPPVKSSFKNNIVYRYKSREVFALYSDMSGINFAGNLLTQVDQPKVNGGFSRADLTMARNANGLLVPTDKKFSMLGASANLKPIPKSAVGPQWYEKKDDWVAFDSGKTVKVDAQENAVFAAIAAAKSGDLLLLAPGTYKLEKLLDIQKVLTLAAAQPNTVVLVPLRTSLFNIQNGGSLKLANLTIDGSESPDSAGNTLIKTPKSGMYKSYRLVIENSLVKNLNVNHSHHFLDVGWRSLAEEIRIENSRFENITGDLLRLDKETDDLGNYNTETVIIKNSQFSHIDGALLSLYRGGTDESTFGPHLLFVGNQLEQVGKGGRNKRQASLYLHGVQFTRVQGNHFKDTAGLVIEHTVGDPDTEISDNQFQQVPALQSVELHYKGPSTVRFEHNSVQP